MKSRKPSIPYIIWMAVFTMIPMIMVGITAFTGKNGGFSLEAFEKAFFYKEVFLRSLWIALISTAICLLIAYPLAYMLTKMKPSTQNFVNMLLMIPMWMNFLLRIYAWVTILQSNGPLDTILSFFGIHGAVQPLYEDSTMVITASGNLGEADAAIARAEGTSVAGDMVSVTMSEQDTIVTEVRFSDGEDPYSLYVTPRMEAENLAVRTLVQMAPWLLLVLLVFSLLCAFGYSRYITRPIVRLSGIAQKMAGLDFHWECGERRRDEIGQLGRSLDQMSHRLSASLAELEAANQTLRGEIERERERQRQRTAFFSAASHELKTPVTILKGQLTGMLEGVDVYRDRDKYLLRSLQVTGRMESLIQEMLNISRVEQGIVTVEREAVGLAALLEKQLSQDAGLLEQRGQRLSACLTTEITVEGDPSLLGKAVGNLLSNAALYSPEGAEIRVWCGLLDGCVCCRKQWTA